MISKDLMLDVSFLEQPQRFWMDAKRIALDAKQKTGTLLTLHEPLTIRLVNNPRGVIPGFGHGGHTNESGTEIRIDFDPKFENRWQLLHVELPRSISHELHHAVRFHTLGYAHSLQEAVITEGLATHFEIEVWGGDPSAWAIALEKSQLPEIVEQFKEEVAERDTEYNHSRWFYGNGDLPRWAGYALGHYFIDEYLKLHPDQTAATLVVAPATEILQALNGSIL